MYISDTRTPAQKAVQILEAWIAGNNALLAGKVVPDKRKHYENETKELNQIIEHLNHV